MNLAGVSLRILGFSSYLSRHGHGASTERERERTLQHLHSKYVSAHPFCCAKGFAYMSLCNPYSNARKYIMAPIPLKACEETGTCHAPSVARPRRGVWLQGPCFSPRPCVLRQDQDGDLPACSGVSPDPPSGEPPVSFDPPPRPSPGLSGEGKRNPTGPRRSDFKPSRFVGCWAGGRGIRATARQRGSPAGACPPLRALPSVMAPLLASYDRLGAGGGNASFQEESSKQAKLPNILELLGSS